MDELTLDGEKYISTKLAAKITGYAKDYVGQLSREGRVTARQVGRSWYVLESAIREHRFGAQEKPQNESPVVREAYRGAAAHSTWETPRYEAAEVKAIPQVMRPEPASQTETDTPEAEHAAPALHDAWQEWFAHMRPEQAGAAGAAEVEEDTQAETATPEIENDVEMPAVPEPVHVAEEEEETVVVPLHVAPRPRVQEAEPEPSYAPAREPVRAQEPAPRMPVQQRQGGALRRTVVAVLLVVALMSTISALISTGLAEDYGISVERVPYISGISVYNSLSNTK